MKQFDILDQLVEIGNGYLQTAQVLENGISKPTLANYVKKRKMERVAHGVYLSSDAWPDDLYQIYLLNRHIIYSHETALYLHSLMEREPKYTNVTVKAGYNATHLRKRGLHVFQVKQDVYELGTTEVQTSFGNTVQTYDRERTICDIIRYKDRIDVQIFQYAMKEYMSSTQKNLGHLMAYAEKFQITPAVRTYTEVML